MLPRTNAPLPTFFPPRIIPSSSSSSSSPSSPPPSTSPSSPLRAVLDEYVRRHYTAELAARGFESDGRYLVFAVGDDGLGNKVLPLVSAFLLAVLTERTFLVHWTGSEAVHNTPMFIEELFRPPDGMQWGFEDTARLTLDRALTSTSLNDSAREALRSLRAVYGERRAVRLEQIRALFALLPLSMAEIDLRTADYGPVKESALCDDWRAEYAHVTALLMYGDQYFVPPLQVNSHYRPTIAALFEDTDVFGPLARFLLRPSAAVEAYIGPFMAAHFAPFTIGLQLRRRERLGLKDPEVDLALRCARDIIGRWRADGHPDERVAFFVASDDNGLRQALKGRLQDVGAVSFTEEFMLREDMDRGLFYAVVDVLLLSHTSAIVVTPSSTFGYLSHGFGSLVPYRASLMPARQCARAVTAEPSAHFWQPLMREARRQCIDKAQFPTLMAQEECCPRWF